ncbi:precorrin-3B C17-methyltransferase [Candidatus Magnetomoraceae bacterium gMMP-15]
MSDFNQNFLYIVGIGPGSIEHISKRALDVLEKVDTVVGYTTYIELIKPLISDKNTIVTSMKKEVDRIESALNICLSGKSCAVISSGDPGIYAMAGLVFEMCKKKDIHIIPASSDLMEFDKKNSICIEVVPGIPALCSGASLLGAPLTHDFAAISLSDLLTSWELIEKRIEAASMADFVIVLYNPKSKKRNWQLEKAQEIILKYRDKNTPVGIVTSAMREAQNVSITTLENLHTCHVDMQTTVFIGSSASIRYLDFMITPRGYSKKYRIFS